MSIRNKRILLVDDEENILLGYKRNLSKSFDVFTASGGAEGIELIKNSGPFAVIVSDYRMPEMDGVMFLSKARKISPDTVRVILTGYADVKTAIDSVNEGNVFRFLTKPCLGETLINALNASIEQYRLLTAEKELIKLKSRFVSLVSHEYRNPLTKILLSADFLKHYSQSINIEKFHQYIDAIKEAVAEMTGLLNEVLTLGSVEQASVMIQNEPVDLVDLIKDIILNIKFINKNSHNIEFTYQKDICEYQTDEKLIRHIINNLLSNAIKYSPKNTTIDLRLDESDKALSIRIKDSGIGISEKDQKNLFEPFYRCGNTGDIGGTGLGLAIVKSCVDRLNGSIAIESELDKGSVFIVELPRHT